MTGITKAHFDVVFYAKQFVVRLRHKMLQRRFSIFHRIEWLNQRIAAALNLAVQNLRIVLLYMGRIRQHDMRQLAGHFRRIYSPLETLFIEFRHKTAMVDMCMCQNHAVEFSRIEAKLLVIQLAYAATALKHAAVHQNFPLLALQQIARASNCMSSP